MLRPTDLAALLGVLGAAACVTTTTQLSSVSREAVQAEVLFQRQLVLRELRDAQQRLDDIAYPLLLAAAPLCREKTGLAWGLKYRTVDAFSADWATAAVSVLGVSDTLSVHVVARGSAAHTAGIQAGDRILEIHGEPIQPGRNAGQAADRMLRTPELGPVDIRLRQIDTERVLRVTPDTACDFGTIVIAEGDINAFADGRNVGDDAIRER
jgi:membrane-associated protease RseP (regulator of RpoE activity)